MFNSVQAVCTRLNFQTYFASSIQEVLLDIARHQPPLLRFGKADPRKPNLNEWEIELKIPQKHIGQVKRAFDSLQTDELDVDLGLPTAAAALHP